MVESSLLNEINLKTCNKFSFLKLKRVFFVASKNHCEIYLIYPKTYDVSDDDKKLITKIIIDFLALDGASIDVHINKSFIEKDLINREIFNYFKNNNPVLFNGLTSDNIKIDVQNEQKAVITFNLEEDIFDYFCKFKVDKGLLKYLDRNFCCSFEVFENNIGKKSFEQNFLDERIENLKKESDLNSIIGQNIEKYIVLNKKVIVGQEITFNPRYISSINHTMESCVIAGKIHFLTERTFKSKRTKKNKDGSEENIVKPYFNFQLKDSSASIFAVIFPSKANYHKMHLLKDGDNILVRGKIERYNDKFEVSVKDISLCEIPSKTEVRVNMDKNEITDYRFVRPVRYTSAKQSNLFESKQDLSREIQTQSYVVYDFETTGIDVSKDEIIEIGALKIENGQFTYAFSCLVKPKNPIPAEATKVNRITNEMVANAYSIEQVICDFYLFCKDCQMVGYNSIAFDSRFLLKAGKTVGLNFEQEQIDAFLLAKDKLRGLKNYKLGTVANYLDVNLIDAHRALNDVVATAEVFMKLY